jgi:hypothetical protein
MNFLSVICALTCADFLERVRRYSFFLTMLFALFLGYGAATGRISIRMGNDYRGVYTSAWIGALVALVTTAFVSLIGFYIVKGSVDRDRQTGVGQILAATPLSRPAYALGKFLSNLCVLTSVVAVLAVCALVMQGFTSEEAHVDGVALLAPFVLVAFPAMALTAALAVLFEMLPLLNGGVGNVLWLFVWGVGGLGLAEISGNPRLDPMGILTVAKSMQAAAAKTIPGYQSGFALGIAPGHLTVIDALRWHGVAWTSEMIGLRVAWFAAALAIALLAAVFFDRFDPAKAPRFWLRRPKPVAQNAGMNRSATLGVTPADEAFFGAGFNDRPLAAAQSQEPHLTALTGAARRKGFGRLFVAEFGLAVQGRRWWWYAIALGLLVAQFATPLGAARGPLLGSAWLWCVLLWSAMGSRESRWGTRGLLFSCSGILSRQVPACYLAGVAIAVLSGAGVAVRLWHGGDTAGLLGFLAGVFFLPSLALALGTVSGTGKAFEAILTAWWYIGPMNHTQGFDFTGAANGAATLRYAGMYAALTAALLATAFLARWRQLRNN